jgi:hypothetical protein
MANRFEQVDEVANDAISVILEQRADGQWARIYCPASAGEGVKQNRMSASAAPKDALSSAVKFANEMKLPIVVIDPDNVWKKEWGELYRWSGDEDEA